MKRLSKRALVLGAGVLVAAGTAGFTYVSASGGSEQLLRGRVHLGAPGRGVRPGICRRPDGARPTLEPPRTSTSRTRATGCGGRSSRSRGHSCGKFRSTLRPDRSSATSRTNSRPADQSDAGGGHDRVGDEAGEQAEQQAVGEQVAAAGLGGDAEQLDDDVEDRAGREGQEDDADRLAGEAVADRGADERRPAADQRRAAEQEPQLGRGRRRLGRRRAARRCRSPRSRCAARTRSRARWRGRSRRWPRTGRSRAPRRSCAGRSRPRSAAPAGEPGTSVAITAERAFSSPPPSPRAEASLGSADPSPAIHFS